MNFVRGWHNAMRETHSPGQRGRPSVVAVARKKAADSTDRIADASSRPTSIKKLKNCDFLASRHQDQRNKAADKSAKPRKAEAGPEHWPWISEKFAWRLKDMIKPGADDSRETSNANNHEGIGLDAAPDKVGLNNISRNKKPNRDHQAKCRDRNRTQRDIRKHGQREYLRWGRKANSCVH